MARWTDSDNLHARDALIVGGPNDGLRIAVNDGPKGLRYPDVLDMRGYHFDRERWRFVYAPCRVCDGHGNIWVSWSSDRPVDCGHCHATGVEAAA